MQSPITKTQRICHTRKRSLSYQPFAFPADRQFPLYAHCNPQRYRQQPRLRCNTSLSVPSRPGDLMQTIDYRYSQGGRRSSFALSDIFELDEEDIEIEVSPVLPSTPNSSCSISTTRSVKARMMTVLILLTLPKELVHAMKIRLGRERSVKMYVVTPADRDSRIDLL